MKYSVIILCAGSGTRTGLTYNKMLYKIEDKTVYERTIDLFLNDKRCQQIIVVTKESEIEEIKQIVVHDKITYVYGGKERQDSVYEGLQVVSSPYVMIHDGARPYVKKEQIGALLEGLKTHQACLLMVPCKDTIKEVRNGKVIKTLPRETLMQAQTPQAFNTDVIKKAYQKAKEEGFVATDDASLVETFSKEDVYAVMGSYENIKITTKEDL
ncbi:MAG: 2-C-methyl-D-erythritol 4-phosphate cytidylyltransferase [Coprobacillaceae bacterium]